MGSSIVVTSENFATEVLEKSNEQIVIVDFFAPWCGPCQIIKPMLEKLVQEYDFVLAKVDIDENPDLAQTYGVQGIPDVRIVADGKVNQGFVGALPESELRQLIAQLNPPPTLDASMQKVYDAAAINQLSTAESLLNTLLEQHSNNRGVILEAINFYIETNQIERAQALLTVIEHETDYAPQIKLLKALIFFKQIATEPETSDDRDRLFQTAANQVLVDEYQAALDTLLEMLSRDSQSDLTSRTYRDDGVRRAMLTVFDLLGDDHLLTKEYRKKLMSVLY
ncbi:tetratricopeptide repeat protein [Phormidium sp. CLA17]|uniref:tetratricopeptide repeat protein n=1 Tax=Leptolyngbya sp. Cla-17 TaxID=2803751 RepID=UPI001491CBEC|nr:tetratricopeptide repeat protein [Leptolyngbya sp. Cla-17]MBM0743447.1 tetratricopeptide repeat protein [Leptolyngbya sp. Cla-17]